MGSQEQAIQKIKGPCIILAGAGTGKTYTIVEKIKYLLKNKIYPPEKIVCLTFSNEAANSLRNRILKVLEDDKEPIIKTFHSFCSDLLKKHGEKMGINENFKILLPEDAKIILHKNFKVPPLNCHKYISTIGTAKDLGITINEIDKYLEKNLPKQDLEKEIEDLSFKLKTIYLKNSDKKEKRYIQNRVEFLQKLHNLNKFLKSWKAYEKIKSIRNLEDYSDLNKNAIELLEKNPEIVKNFDYIIVDEFQDTNKQQFELLKLICPHKNITVVGDLNQSIYRFRGAYKENFNLFKKHFETKESDLYTLNKSYRSPNKILKIAHKLIEKNYQKKEECFFVENANNQDGEKIKTFELKNSKEEIRKIIEIIKEEIKQGIPENEICVMFRTHQQARLLKKALDYENLPYSAVASKSLLKTAPIKTTVDYLRIISSIKNNKSGSESSWWNLFYSSSFPEEDLIKIGRFIKMKKENLNQELLNSDLKLSEIGKVKLNLIRKRINALLEINEELPKLILKIYEIAGLNSEEELKKESLLSLQKFHEFVQEYVQFDSDSIEDFLYHISIMENLGIEIEAPSVEDSGIRIMTQHSTKGLEYQTVIVTNLAQKRFPVERITTNSLIPSELSPEIKDMLTLVPETEKEEIIKEHERQNQLLEERRLCYVAFTRAKEKLFLTYSKEYGGKKFSPSQFLNEIDYKKNPEIEFIRDNQDKYQEPKILIKPAKEFENKTIRFSPSSLLLFDECQKKYEYKYIYNMPEPKPVSWEAIKLGSFIHHIIDEGLKKSVNSEKEFIILAKTRQAEEEWNFIYLDEAIPLIKVFYERNKNKYKPNSLTEINLSAKIQGLNFQGFADRIDFTEKGVEIIDYKTGNSPVPPRNRNWQLGFYALAAKEKYGRVYKLTLDMLKKERPIEFILDDNGNAFETGGRMSFNLDEIREEMIQTAKNILECYKNGFKPCPIEKNCDFCNEFIWNL